MQVKGSLSPRLEAVISLVRHGVVTADIGCDHAFVSVELVKRKISKYAYLCDIRQGPLNAANVNVNEYCAKSHTDKESFFKLVLTDGLCGLKDVSPEPCDIIIAGMGGELIAKILDESEYSRKVGVRFILQPMTSQYELRKYLASSGIGIISQRYIKEDNKIYQIILCEYNGVPYTVSDVEAEVGWTDSVHTSDGDVYLKLIEKKISEYKKIAAARVQSGVDNTHQLHMADDLENLYHSIKTVYTK